MIILALYGMSLDMLAQFYLSINKLSEAENLWREAVKIGTALHGAVLPQIFGLFEYSNN